MAFSAPFVALTGCQFIDLGRDLEEMNKFSTIRGTIAKEAPSDSPIAVALFSGRVQRDSVVNAKLIETGEFDFGVPPGKYFIFAFEDRNRDFQYQPNEAAGFYGAPTPITIKAGGERVDIRITLRHELKLPTAENNGAGRQDPDNRNLPKLWAGRKNIGTVSSLTDPRFDRKFAKLGLWEPLRFSLEVGPGIFLLEPYNPNKIPIVFVHGIGGSPRTWQKIIEKLDRRRYQPWFFHYASGLPLDANAAYMIDAVSQLRLVHRFDTMFLMAHSMGGLVSQAFINLHRPGRARYLKLFVTLSTPWAGHSAAQLGVDYAPAVVPVWRDMAPDSVFLKTLRQKRRSESGPPHHLLFSYRGGGFPSSIANDGSVTVASQLEPWTQDGAKRIYGFDTGHVDILSDDAVIRLITRILN